MGKAFERFQILVDDSDSDAGYVATELFKRGQLAAVGSGDTVDAAIADVRRQYRIKRARRRARNAGEWVRDVHSRPTLRP